MESSSVANNTNGWDLVAAIRQSETNKLFEHLYNVGVIPNQFTADMTDPFSNTQVSLTASFSAPTVKIDTEDQNMLHVYFPLTGGTVGINPIPPSGLTIVVTTNLNYVELQLQDQTSVLRLSIDFTSDQAVFGAVMDGNPPNWNPTFNNLLGPGLQTWFQKEAGTTNYQHPFYLGDVVLSSSLDDMKPSGIVDFTTQVVDKTTGDNNIVAMLIQTVGGNTGISNDFSNNPSLIPTGQTSSLLISNSILMSRLIGPSLASNMGFPASALQYSGGGESPVSISLKTKQYLGGKYKMYLYKLEISVGTDGTIDISYEVHAHPLINTKEVFYIKVTGTVTITPSLQTNQQGLQEIAFNGISSKPKGEIECKKWVYPIVAAAIVASFGSLFVLYGFISAAVVTILMATLTFNVGLPNNIKKELEEGLAAFTWPLQQSYLLNAVELPGDLGISGQPNI